MTTRPAAGLERGRDRAADGRPPGRAALPESPRAGRGRRPRPPRSSRTADGRVAVDRALHVRAGEIVGIAGLEGSGRGDAGEDARRGRAGGRRPPDSCTATPLARPSPGRAMRRGLGFVPPDRRRQGIVPTFSVGRSITLASLWSIARGSVIRRRVERARRAALHRPVRHQDRRGLGSHQDPVRRQPAEGRPLARAVRRHAGADLRRAHRRRQHRRPRRDLPGPRRPRGGRLRSRRLVLRHARAAGPLPPHRGDARGPPRTRALGGGGLRGGPDARPATGGSVAST